MTTAVRMIGWIAALVTGALLGLPAGQLPGELAMSWGPWHWQGPVWWVAAGLVLAWIGLYLVTRAFFALAHAPRGWSRWRAHRGERQRERHLERAWEALCQGRYRHAVGLCEGISKALDSRSPGAVSTPMSLLTAWIGFASARRLADAPRARDFLEHLLRSLGPSETNWPAPDEVGDIDSMVLDSLGRWLEARPGDIEVRLALVGQRLQRGEREQAQDWLGAHPGDEAAPAWVPLAASLAVDALAKAKGRDELAARWQGLEAGLRERAEVSAAYVGALLCLDGNPDEEEIAAAQALLTRSLETRWRDDLAALYARLPARVPLEQLAVIETWLSERPASPVLLRAAGQASVRAQLWGKARAYLRASAQIAPLPGVLFELGRLETRLGQAEDAAAWIERGVASFEADEFGGRTATRAGASLEPMPSTEVARGDALGVRGTSRRSSP